MKTKMVVLSAAVLFLAGCSSTETASGESGSENAGGGEQAAQEEAAEEQEAGATPPSIGMTKAQVRAKYGTPVNIAVTGRGEVWSYVFNNWDSRSLIPYYGAVHNALKQRHSGVVHFDASGRVRDFTWNQSNPVGGTVWR